MSKLKLSLTLRRVLFTKTTSQRIKAALVNIGLQIKAAKFSSITPLKLAFEKQVVCKAGQIAVILKPESSTIRILGSGTIQ